MIGRSAPPCAPKYHALNSAQVRQAIPRPLQRCSIGEPLPPLLDVRYNEVEHSANRSRP